MEQIKYLLLLLLLYSCSNNNSDNVTISKKEYNILKGDTVNAEFPISIQPLKWGINITLVTLKNHEYLYIESGGYGGCSMTHFPDCKFCKQIKNK